MAIYNESNQHSDGRDSEVIAKTFYAVLDDCGQYLQSGYNCTSEEEVKAAILDLIEPETETKDFKAMQKMTLDRILDIKGWELQEDNKKWPDAFEEEDYSEVSESPTKGEWKIDYRAFGEYTIHTDEMDIATVWGIDIPEEEAQANAELICKAVNNYSKLVEENENLKRENNRLKHYYEIACDEVNKSWIPKHNKLVESNRELMAEIERLLQQWDRQKNLFPELMKDGWMELEMKNAQTILNNAKNL